MGSATAETLRPIAEKACRDVVGHSDGTIIMGKVKNFFTIFEGVIKKIRLIAFIYLSGANFI